MGRIPDDEIERLKREISLESLVRARGVELERQGENLVGRCCFHEDKTPSFIVTPSKNLWHCMGACQKGGDVIQFVMVAEGASFRHAVELLRRGVTLTPSTRETAAAPKHKLRRKLEPLAEASTDDAELMSRVVDVYHETLKESPEALAYLASRGLEDPELIARFKLGFSNRTLGYRLPQAAVKSGAELRSRLTTLGVLRESGHEHLRGTITIPLFDAEGRVVQIYGRKIENRVPKGVPLHLYLPSPQRGVFNREELGRESDEVILCEAIVDALTFWRAGHRNVTTAYGVEGFTEEIADALVKAGIQVVKIAFDRDEAGDRGAEKVSAKLKALGIETQRVLFPKGMDANEYARKVQPADKSLRLVLERAEWMSRSEVEAADVMPQQRTSGGAISKPAEPPKSSGGLDSAPPPIKEEERPDAHATAEVPLAPPARSLAAASSSPVKTTSPEIRAAKASQEAATIPPLAASPSSARGPATAKTTLSSGRTPAPPAPSTSAPEPVEKDGELVFRFASRTWHVTLFAREDGRGGMKAKMKIVPDGGRRSFFIDVLDVHASRQRAGFIKAAAHELELDGEAIASELEIVLKGLEGRREERKREALAPPVAATMSEEEREAALNLLRDPKLLDRVVGDLTRAGIVGEETNKLVAYLAATSRKLEDPLAVVIQSSSAAGKSTVMDTVLQFIPEEDRVQYSAMTGQSLFYMGHRDLRHKVLAIVEEEGAERASYALKLLQSEGELTMAAPGKDPVSGKLMTHEYRVEGPVMIMLTTTAIEVDEELLNRCVVLTVDESREQTRAIHQAQRHAQTLEGLIEKQERPALRRLHRNAQRLIRPLMVVNGFAEELRFVDHTTRTRRDHMKLLNLIRVVALVHQHQRPIKTTTRDGKMVEYIEATRADVNVAMKLAHAVLGRSLDDLPPQTRRLLDLIYEMAKARAGEQGLTQSELRFSRREVREETGWSIEQLRVHLGRLVELEYLLVHRGKRGQSYEYELMYEGEGANGKRFLLGLGAKSNGMSTTHHLGVS